MRLTQEQYDKAKPMHANQEMVRAMLDGRKTQTRRPIPEKVMADMRIAQQIGEVSDFYDTGYLQKGDESYIIDFARYQPGDIIYIKETWLLYNHIGTYNGKSPKEMPKDLGIGYKADELDEDTLFTWRHSNHMPKWASRLFYEIKAVHVAQSDKGIWEFVYEIERILK